MTTNSDYLPGTDSRGHWLRVDVAAILKRFFLCEQSLIVSQAGWLPAIAPFEVKLTLPRFLWEDAMTANALRERVFELKFPSRLLEIGQDGSLIQLLDEAINAPGPEAFVLSLAQVFKPALLEAYEQYVAQTDEIADGPTLRFLQLAVTEKRQQVQTLSRFAAEMLAAAPERRSEAEAWSVELSERLAAIGGISLNPPAALTTPVRIPGRREFEVAEVPARDPRYHQCRFYWPDIIDPDFGYGQGMRLQLRSAVSHLNEVWAVEASGAFLYAFAELLGWDYIYDAARWSYDEARHCRMGLERLQRWGFEPNEVPLGSYIYDSTRGQGDLYRLGMVYYFETRFIGKKTERAKAFGEINDRVSQHDMDFDWADETIHAHYGQRWLTKLHDLSPDTFPSPRALRSRCAELVATIIESATETERRDIHRVARRMIAKAEMKIRNERHLQHEPIE